MNNNSRKYVVILYKTLIFSKHSLYNMYFKYIITSIHHTNTATLVMRDVYISSLKEGSIFNFLFHLL